MLSKDAPLKGLVRLFLFISIAGSCLLTVIGYSSMNALTKTQAQAKYEKQTKQITSQIGERMDKYVDILYQARAFVLVKNKPTQAEWVTYFESQGVFQGQSGVDAVGFSRYAKGNSTQIGNLLSKDHGIDVKVSPLGERSEYLPLVTVATANPATPKPFGFDLLSEPARNLAITEARNTGAPALTAPVSAVPSGKRAVIMVLPVYLDNSELYGFITAVYYTESFVEGLDLGSGELATNITDATSQQEVYASPYQVKGAQTTRSDKLKMNSREWAITYSSPNQVYGDGHFIPYVILFIGSVLVVGLLSSSRLILKIIDRSSEAERSHSN